MPKFKDWKHAELFVNWAQRMVDAGKLEAFDREAVMESKLIGSDTITVCLESENARNLCQWNKSGPAGKLLFAAPYDGRADAPVPSYATPSPDCLAKREETPVESTAHTGNKYHREIRDIKGRLCMVLNAENGEYEPAKVDYYSIEKACAVLPGGVTHAGKKVLFAGIRGKGTQLQDLKEASDALTREIDELETRETEK